MKLCLLRSMCKPEDVYIIDDTAFSSYNYEDIKGFISDHIDTIEDVNNPPIIYINDLVDPGIMIILFNLFTQNYIPLRIRIWSAAQSQYIDFDALTTNGKE